MKFINEIVEIMDLMYIKGWDERNGGNISYLLDEEEIKTLPSLNTQREIIIDLDLSYLVGKFFVVTGTGKYFKNAKKQPEDTLGIIKVVAHNKIGIIWGYANGGLPTSELPTHLLSHIARLRIDTSHRVVMHCHPINLICMTHVHSLDENLFTKTLWKMQTESIVVFPEGVGVLPWMVCGGREIGEATAAKISEYRAVLWSKHGIFAVGATIDEVFGLIETIEKAAEIFIKIASFPQIDSITDEELKALAKAFKVTYKKGII